MRRLVFGLRLLAEVYRMSRARATWWLLPLVVVVLALSALAVAVQLTVPFTMYTLF